MESIRIGDIQTIKIEVHGVSISDIKQIAIAGINNGKTKFLIPTEHVVYETQTKGEETFVIAKFLLDADVSWSLQEGNLKLQVKINLMSDNDGDGTYSDLNGEIGTQTTKEVELKVLPTLFEQGNVKEGNENVGWS